MNDAIALMREKTEQDLVEMKASQEKLQSAHGEIAASVIEIKATQQELAAAVKAITGQLTNAVELFKQGQSAVATGSNNNGGEDKKGLEEKETTGAATPARLNLKYIIHGMGSSHLLTNAAAQAYRTTTHTSSANEGGSGMSAADRLRQRLALGQTQGSVGEITPTGDPFRAVREQYGKDDDLVTSGRGSTGGDGGDPGTGGEKPSTTGCFITVTSERPWVSDIYVIKDSFADNARKEKVIKPRENFGCAWSTAGAAARWGDWYFPIVGG